MCFSKCPPGLRSVRFPCQFPDDNCRGPIATGTGRRTTKPLGYPLTCNDFSVRCKQFIVKVIAGELVDYRLSADIGWLKMIVSIFVAVVSVKTLITDEGDTAKMAKHVDGDVHDRHGQYGLDLARSYADCRKANKICRTVAAVFFPVDWVIEGVLGFIDEQIEVDIRFICERIVLSAESDSCGAQDDWSQSL